jgi:hypothetical protein
MSMKASLVTTTIILGIISSVPALADNSLVRFDGGIASQPLRSGPAVNVVRGVNPGGIPWVIERLSARVSEDGRISVSGRGLLLAGGDGVGTTGGQSVRARLFCGNVSHDTGLVALEADGDFRIDDVLSPLPPVPCDNPALLIVNAAGAWFAAGILKR